VARIQPCPFFQSLRIAHHVWLVDMSLLPGAKNVFGRSFKPKKSMNFDAGIDPVLIKSATFPAQPITLAIVGCGQRGKVGTLYLIDLLSTVR
jgi:hypothetical protein